MNTMKSIKDIPEKDPPHCLLGPLISAEVVAFLEVLHSSEMSQEPLIPDFPPPPFQVFQ